MGGQKWTEAEKDILRRYYPVESYAGVVQRLHRPPTAIRIMVIRMGLHYNNHLPHWSKEEKDTLSKLYPTASHQELISALNKPLKNILSQAFKMGLRRTWYKRTLIERFNKFVMPEPNSGCWLWFGKTNKAGYGSIKASGETITVHRLSWEIHNGPIPDGLCVLHHCDNPPCVNPRHLFLGTNQDNKDDCCKKKRQAYGSRNGKAKLRDDDIVKIREDARPIKEIAKSFGISRVMVYDIKKNKFWKHLANSSCS